MLSCKETSQLISEGQERKLSLLERINLRIHLFACTSCSRFEHQMRFLRKALKKHFSDEQSTSQTPLPKDSKERILKAIKERTDNQ